MIKPYESQYVEIAMDNLGEAIDYVSSVVKMDADLFIQYFIRSGYAEQFERGNPRVLFGMSGTELVDHVLMESKENYFPLPVQEQFEYSAYYWAGWILAYYQWVTQLPFSRIMEFITMHDIILMYHPLHEAPVEKFVDIVNRLKDEHFVPGMRLRKMRKAAGLSQRELAEKSGVGIRAIQQYEQGAKRIDLASGRILYSLSVVLQCHMEDLLDLIE